MKKKYNKNSKLQGPIQKEESPEKMTNIKRHDKQWKLVKNISYVDF